MFHSFLYGFITEIIEKSHIKKMWIGGMADACGRFFILFRRLLLYLSRMGGDNTQKLKYKMLGV